MTHKWDVVIGAALLVLVVAFWAPRLIRPRSTPSMNACVNNLRQIDGAK